MEQILLTKKEILKALNAIDKNFQNTVYASDIRIAKDQLKKVRGKIAVVEIPEGKNAGYNVDGRQYIALAMSHEDWQALLKEAE